MRDLRLGLVFIIVIFVLAFTQIYNLYTKLDQHIEQSRKNNVQTKQQFQLNSEDDIVVVYNRVPKTGSTSFVNVAYDLCKRNKFHTLHVNVTGNNHVLSLANQYKIVQNITHWDNMKPAVYHGHFAFIDFAKFSARKPLFINIVRKPLDRLISYYYFLRYGDNYRPYLIRKKHGDTMTFDECFLKNQADCDPNNMWLQIPFFCGHSVECWKPGNSWALEEAKKNLINNYLLVGVTDELNDFVNILEQTIPRIFKGAGDYFMNSNKSHLRRTVQKTEPSEETVRKIQQHIVWQMENELYEYALEQFHFVKSHSDKLQSFMYEKVRPK